MVVLSGLLDVSHCSEYLISVQLVHVDELDEGVGGAGILKVYLAAVPTWLQLCIINEAIVVSVCFAEIFFGLNVCSEVLRQDKEEEQVRVSVFILLQVLDEQVGELGLCDLAPILQVVETHRAATVFTHEDDQLLFVGVLDHRRRHDVPAKVKLRLLVLRRSEHFGQFFVKHRLVR